MTKLNEMQQATTFIPHTYQSWMVGIFEAIEGCNTTEDKNGFAKSTIFTVSEMLAEHMVNFTDEKKRDERTKLGNHAVALALALGVAIGKYGHTEKVTEAINKLREKMLAAGFKFTTECNSDEFKKVAAQRNMGSDLVKKLDLADLSGPGAEKALKSASEIIDKISKSIQNDLKKFDTSGLEN